MHTPPISSLLGGIEGRIDLIQGGVREVVVTGEISVRVNRTGQGRGSTKHLILGNNELVRVLVNRQGGRVNGVSANKPDVRSAGRAGGRPSGR